MYIGKRQSTFVTSHDTFRGEEARPSGVDILTAKFCSELQSTIVFRRGVVLHQPAKKTSGVRRHPIGSGPLTQIRKDAPAFGGGEKKDTRILDKKISTLFLERKNTMTTSLRDSSNSAGDADMRRAKKEGG